ncbi:hypothetical protein [Desulfopila sp. IMCC35008]|nr:hypothetical protein [Desulfopila sp. IMCC35008]
MLKRYDSVVVITGDGIGDTVSSHCVNNCGKVALGDAAKETFI